jgi:delta 1-pyrroline-5-carboxylate dehydrogenase
MVTDYLAHITWCEKNTTFITCCPLKNTSSPLFVSPTVYELHNIEQLPTKSIGPVLYVIRYTDNDIEKITQALHLRRHASTLAIYSTLEDFTQKLQPLSSHTAINCRVPYTTKQYMIHTAMTSEALWQPYIMEQKLCLPSI